jgi:hypothetical protein
MMMKTNLNFLAARGLLIASLVLIVLYLVGEPLVHFKEDRAFYFAAPAIVLSIVAFGISFREKSIFISILLVINGVILVVDRIIGSYDYLISGDFTSQAASSSSGFVVLSLVVLGTGIVKCIMTFRKTPSSSSSTATTTKIT